jgi:hypothetical protein
VHPPLHRHPRMMTRPTPREPPHGPHAPRGRPAPHDPPALWPSAVPESSADLGHAAPLEAASIIAERPLCPTNKNITYIK